MIGRHRRHELVKCLDDLLQLLIRRSIQSLATELLEMELCEKNQQVNSAILSKFM